MLSVNIDVIAIITVKNVDYRCIIHNISKCEAINLLKNDILENRGYIFFTFQSIQISFFYFFCLVYIKWLILWIILVLEQ